MPIPISLSANPAVVGNLGGRLRFPSTDDRLVYESPGPNLPLYSRAGAKVRVYTDPAGSTPADIVFEDGSPVANAELTVNNDSQIPQFFGPVGVEVLYVRANGGDVYPMYAWLQARVNALETTLRSLGVLP